jgi:large subunit ribosomal protein L15
MILDDVHRGITKHKARKRIGRGPGSGHGKTSGRGHKGFYSRSGSSSRSGHEGGQTPLFRRVAKRGFSNNYFRLKVAVINLATLEEAFEAGAVITPEELVGRGLTNGKFDVIKILGTGELSKKLTIRAHRFSESAKQKIAAAGGTAEVVE